MKKEESTVPRLWIKFLNAFNIPLDDSTEICYTNSCGRKAVFTQIIYNENEEGFYIGVCSECHSKIFHNQSID